MSLPARNGRGYGCTGSYRTPYSVPSAEPYPYRIRTVSIRNHGMALRDGEGQARRFPFPAGFFSPPGQRCSGRLFSGSCEQ
jgi:hypothetical protein